MPDPKTRILNRLAEIKLEIDSTTQDRATVILDQQSIGRLSRMDAMQQQAMANATHQRRKNEQIRLSAALVRLETGEYNLHHLRAVS
jgi:DnaK suppressor protein